MPEPLRFVHAAVTELAEQGVAARASSSPACTSALLDLLTADQARQLAGSLCRTSQPAGASGGRQVPRVAKAGGTKADALSALRRQLVVSRGTAAAVATACEELVGACVCITPIIVLLMERMQRIYFLSEAQVGAKWLSWLEGAPLLRGNGQGSRGQSLEGVASSTAHTCACSLALSCFCFQPP